MAHLLNLLKGDFRRCAFFIGKIAICALIALLTIFALGRPGGIIFQSQSVQEPDISSLIVKTSVYDNPKYIEKPNFVPETDVAFGQIDIDKQNIHMPIKWGTIEEGDLHNTGMYSNSALPGKGGTTLISGHNYPSFGKIYYLTIGDTFQITVPWGVYTYRITQSRVMPAAELEQSLVPMLEDKSVRGAVLYSCYPLTALNTPDRSVITAELIEGPLIPTDKEKDYE